jgi:hypothetical protein
MVHPLGRRQVTVITYRQIGFSEAGPGSRGEREAHAYPTHAGEVARSTTFMFGSSSSMFTG